MSADAELLATRTNAVASALKDGLSYCSGTAPVFANQNLIFFRQGDAANFIDLSQGSTARLRDLAAMCTIASSSSDGRRTRTKNMHKVLDEKDFSFKLDPNSTPIIDLIKSVLLDGKDEQRPVKAELCNLTFHDKDAYAGSMKPSNDQKNFLGVLRLCFPTRLTGGSITIRHKKEAWTVNPTNIPPKLKWPACVFIASVDGVSHEVAAIEAGNLVTVTYNLFFADEDAEASRETRRTQVLPKPNITSQHNPSLHSFLTGLLQTPELLPQGGYLAFNLSHFYPALNHGGGSAKPATLAKSLKQRDLIIQEACQALELFTSAHIVVEDVFKDNWLSLDQKVEMVTLDNEVDTWAEHFGGRRLVTHDDTTSNEEGIEYIHWVVPFDAVEERYLGHCQFMGEDNLAKLIQSFCLLAKVGPFDQRETL